MKAGAVILLVALACLLVYLTFINRSWAGNSLPRVALLMAIAALMGVAWAMARSPNQRKDQG